MSLAKWTLVTESLGTIAIIVSLLFVGYEIRQNTTADYAATYEALGKSQIEWRLAIASNPKLLEAWSEGVGFDLPAPDFHLLIEALYLNYEQAYFARSYGRLGDREWERYDRSMCNPKAGRQLLEDHPPGGFTKEFWSYIQECSSRS